MESVRPHEIFSRFQSKEPVCLRMPQGRRELGLTLLETCLLIAIGRGVGAKQIFEFGTWKGYTACALGANIPGVQITTLNLMDEWDCDDWQGPLVCLFGDSRGFDFSPWKDSVDLVFIDGGHDLETVQADTAHALRLLRPGGCIAWHDYRNPEFPELTAYLDAKPLVHVQETWLAFSFPQFSAHPLP